MVDHAGKEVTDLYPVETFDQQLIPGQLDDLMQNETLMEIILPDMITAATKIAETLGATEISNGIQKMNLTLDHEIGRLRSLHEKNKHIRPEEIQLALREQTTLASLIGDARIRLDALQLIRKGDF